MYRCPCRQRLQATSNRQDIKGQSDVGAIKIGYHQYLISTSGRVRQPKYFVRVKRGVDNEQLDMSDDVRSQSWSGREVDTLSRENGSSPVRARIKVMNVRPRAEMREVYLLEVGGTVKRRAHQLRE